MKKIKILKKYIFLIFLVFIFFIFFNGTGSNQTVNTLNKIIHGCIDTEQLLKKNNMTPITNRLMAGCIINKTEKTKQQIIIEKDEKLNIFYRYQTIKTTTNIGLDMQQIPNQNQLKDNWTNLYTDQSTEFLFYDNNDTTKIKKISKNQLLEKIIDYYNKPKTSNDQLEITITAKYNRIIKLKYLDINLLLDGENEEYIYWIKNNKITKNLKRDLTVAELTKAKQELLRSNKINQTKNLSFRSNSYFYFETEKFVFLSNKPSFDIILYARKKGINGTEFTKLYNSENNHFYLLNEKNNILKLNIREQYKYIKNFKNFILDKEKNENTDLIFKQDFAYIRTKLYLDNKSKKLNRVRFFLNKNTEWKTFELPKKGFFLWFGKINQTKNKLLSIYKKLSKLSIIGFGSGGGLIFAVLILYGIKKLSDRRY